MKIVCAPFLCLAVIMNSIGMSLQSNRSSDEDHSSGRSQGPAEPITRARSRSPTLRETFPGVLGYKLEDLEFIRLRPYCCPNRVFELRRYVFPPDKPIGLRTCPGVIKPMPAGERIVLSTSNGDVYAMMDKRNKHIVFRAICISVSGKARRVKINMNTGAVRRLTSDESAECPVPLQEQIAKNFAVFRADTTISHTGSSSQSQDHCGPSSSSPSRPSRNITQSLVEPHPSTVSPPPSEPPLRNKSRSSTIRQTFPTVLGYSFKDLETIRLAPYDYPHRIFELRIYDFPSDKPIGLRTRNYILNPMPPGDQIVLSTSNGDVYAILLKKSSRGTILRPIFMYHLGILERVKINMNSGNVEGLSTAESAECPVAVSEVITKSYRVFHV